MRFPFPPFEPDRVTYDPAGSGNVLNAVPVQSGWGPAKKLVPYTDAVASTPLATFMARLSTGTQVAFIFTASAIYKVENDGSLTDVSGTTYTATEWSVDLFGDRVIATNITDGPQYFDVGSSSAFAALPNAPAGRFVKVVGDFVFIYQRTNIPNGMAWSGINDSEFWTYGENLADQQIIPQGEELQACVVNGRGALWGLRTGFVEMSYAPESGWYFTFSPFVAGKGVSAPRSLVEIGRGDFVYYSDTGFKRGAAGADIGAGRVDEWFKTVCSEANRRQIVGYLDPFGNAVYWRYVKDDGTGALLCYSWFFDRWFHIDVDTKCIGTFATSALTLEDLDTLYPDGIDSIPFSLDSEQFAGGYPSLAGVGSDDRLGFFTGLPLQATFETNRLELFEGSRSFLNEVRLITDAQNKSLVVTKYDFWHSTGTAGSSLQPSPRGGVFNPRADARLHKMTFTIPEDETWTTVSAADVKARASGGL